MQIFEGDPKQLSPLVLAYVGDAVFELYVRTHLAGQKGRLNELHKAAVHYVQAKSQAEIIHQWEPLLTEEEKGVVKRGRNTRSTPPRSAAVADYRYSTGFEALLGYLYLSGQKERLLELLSHVQIELRDHHD
ncbi:MAG: Mini-ribonuclease 3 [Firmicutes bacterium]|jgi:ribonuclease-3 family protein|nr:Mini-ribonuclease 3 [Bacillota bacterium]